LGRAGNLPRLYGACCVQYLPLKNGRYTLGVLAVEPRQSRRLLLPEQSHFLETFAAQIALALERTDLEERAKQLVRVAPTFGKFRAYFGKKSLYLCPGVRKAEHRCSLRALKRP
jgi:K+-sensing histidine kinase KdpD